MDEQLPSYQEAVSYVNEVWDIIISNIFVKHYSTLNLLSRYFHSKISPIRLQKVIISDTINNSAYGSFLKFKSLGPISLNFCHHLDLSNIIEPLYTDFQPNWFFDLLEKCPNLTHLNLSKATFFTNDSIYYFEKSIRSLKKDKEGVLLNLTTLILRKCDGVSDSVLSKFFNFTPNLIYLDLQNCSGCGIQTYSSITQFSQLKSLLFENTTISNDSLHKIIISCSLLEELTICENSTINQNLWKEMIHSKKRQQSKIQQISLPNCIGITNGFVLGLYSLEVELDHLDLFGTSVEWSNNFLSQIKPIASTISFLRLSVSSIPQLNESFYTLFQHTFPRLEFFYLGKLGENHVIKPWLNSLKGSNTLRAIYIHRQSGETDFFYDYYTTNKTFDIDEPFINQWNKSSRIALELRSNLFE